MVIITASKYNKNHLLVAKENLETFLNQLFYVMVETTSTVSVILSKNKKVARFGKALSTIVSAQEELKVYPINTMPIHIEKRCKPKISQVWLMCCEWPNITFNLKSNLNEVIDNWRKPTMTYKSQIARFWMLCLLLWVKRSSFLLSTCERYWNAAGHVLWEGNQR